MGGAKEGEVGGGELVGGAGEVVVVRGGRRGGGVGVGVSNRVARG